MKEYSKKQLEAWDRLEAEVGGETGVKLVEALKSLYEMYTPDMIDWFASLYDPTTGGYYYSESARDGEYTMRGDRRFELRPDAESTIQALGVWQLSGMMRAYGNSKRNAVPSWMREQIVRYIKSLQDPDTGFFYHPQWGKEFTDGYVLRRARDLLWCTGILNDLGSAPTYNSPNGYKGDGIRYDGTSVAVAHDASLSSQAAENTGRERSYHAPHLENKDTFMAYLLDLEEKRKGDFYGIGSQLTSESPQFVERDKALAEEGAGYSLMQILCDWLDTKQDPATGFFTSINGLLKVSGIYSRAQREIPNSELAVQSAIDFILSDKPAGSIVELYNPWNAIANTIGIVGKYGATRVIDGTELTGEERAARLRHIVHETAPATLAKTKEKLAPYAKPRGSFSYTVNGPAINSCGMPVVDKQLFEGDVNATHLASTGLLSGIYSGLALSSLAVPIFSEDDGERYIALLEERCNKAIK